MQESLAIKRTLNYWIPGYSAEQMKNKMNGQELKPFNEEEFLNQIKLGKSLSIIQDDRHLSETEKAFRIAFNPDKRIRSDYECMFYNDDQKNDMEIEVQVQKCENPQCQGVDTKWIECSVCKCWYHQSCAGISLNKTSEEIDQMEWVCKKCKTNKQTIKKK